jgi:hypothetical protein
MILIANNESAERIVRDARPGTQFVYYVGDLAFDRKMGKIETPVGLIARRMMALSDRGIVDLVQRRIDPETFEYIAIRKRPHQPRY